MLWVMVGVQPEPHTLIDRRRVADTRSCLSMAPSASPEITSVLASPGDQAREGEQGAGGAAPRVQYPEGPRRGGARQPPPLEGGPI